MVPQGFACLFSEETRRRCSEALPLSPSLLYSRVLARVMIKHNRATRGCPNFGYVPRAFRIYRVCTCGSGPGCWRLFAHFLRKFCVSAETFCQQSAWPEPGMVSCLHMQSTAFSASCQRPQLAVVRHRLQAGCCPLHRQKCRHDTVCTAATGKFAGKQQQMLVRTTACERTEGYCSTCRTLASLFPCWFHTYVCSGTAISRIHAKSCPQAVQ